MSESPPTADGDAARADRVDRLDGQLDMVIGDLSEVEQRLESVVSRLEAKIESQQQTIKRLENRVQELDDRTDLLQTVEHANQTTATQRSGALLLHLKRKAERNSQPVASVDHQQSEEALSFPDVDRTAIYQDWDRCVRWIGDEDVCWRGERPNGGNQALFLDLGAADDGVISTTVSQESEGV